jgi:aminoglycoside 3-N-acetyltransferase
MPLPDGWRDAAPCTVESLATDLRSLAVRPGCVLLVHASLSALGWVSGGAAGVVLALIDVLGADGTLSVPTVTADNRDPSRWTDPVVPPSWWPAIRRSLPPFDPEVTPSSQMGAVAEQVRLWPGALRSGHPQTSFAADGPSAHGSSAITT